MGEPVNPETSGQADRYEAVLEALSERGGGLGIKGACRLICANQGYLSMTGYSLDELLSRSNLMELAPEELREELTIGLADILAGRRAPSHFLESQLVTKDGRRVNVESSIHMLGTETATRILAIVRDITKRKMIESDIRELNDQLELRVAERTAMLEAARSELDSFSYSVSHDLRAPLRAVLGFSSILSQELSAGLSPEASRYLSLIHENAELMGRLVDSLLALSRLGRRQLRMESVNTRLMVQRAIDKAKAAHPDARVPVTVGKLPNVRADPDLLELVFVTLLDNAIKFSATAPGARIRVGYRDVDG